MKAQLKVEALYDNIYQMMRLWTGIINEGAPSLGDVVVGGFARPYWAAQIVGRDPQYKYARQFLKSKKDYTHANSKGSRGVFVYYLLESGYVYEVRLPKRGRGFYIVDEQGDIVEVDKDYVEQWINNGLGSVSTKLPSSE